MYWLHLIFPPLDLAVSTKVTKMLSGVEAIHVATVLEDCVDQLAILGRIMPASYEEKPDADEVSYAIYDGETVADLGGAPAARPLRTNISLIS